MTTDSRRTALATWLASPEAADALAAATDAGAAHPGDPLTAAARLRRAHPELAPDAAAAVLEQADLRRLAHTRYAMVADDLLLTRDGLEAATRPEVAERRAALVREAGATRVVDLTAGLGFDTTAFAGAGLSVVAVERDPVVATFLRHNCPSVDVVAADALAALPTLLADLSPQDVVFVDPARRDPSAARDARTARARPERDPELWSPPWSTVAALDHPRILAKVSPGFRPPDGWWAQWVSVDRTVVECCVASWPLTADARSAVAIHDGRPTVVAARPEVRVDVSEPLAWVHEPDPAVPRAGALDALAADQGLLRIGPDSTWLTGTHAASSPMLRNYEVLDELRGSAREQRRQLARLGIRRVAVKSREVEVDPRTVLRALGAEEGPDAVIVLARSGSRTMTLVTRAAAPPAR
ncbi:MAG: hypothetical protein GC156_05535 [Actinomycetales bacterium]|nr:hypothetical protein [Actinomycetales bacterium]